MLADNDCLWVAGGRQLSCVDWPVLRLDPFRGHHNQHHVEVQSLNHNVANVAEPVQVTNESC